MCGILGIVSLNNKLKVDKNQFSNCLELMNHRGPDHSEIFENSKTILGHKRLSIIDLSKKGSQPVILESVVFPFFFNFNVVNFCDISHIRSLCFVSLLRDGGLLIDSR